MKSLSMRKMTRRQVLAATATAIPAVGLLAVAGSPPSSAARRAAAGRQPRYSFFNAAEANFIEAACERLVPANASGHGARDIEIPLYLDRHLADAWGNGARLYRLGEWQPGTPCEKHQPAKPAVFFRAALSGIHRDLSRRGSSFAQLPPTAQDDYLASLEAGLPIPGVATAAFFDLLLLMTTEGFFATNTAGAGRRDRLSWPLRGFPGAYASASALGGNARRQETVGDVP